MGLIRDVSATAHTMTRVKTWPLQASHEVTEETNRIKPVACNNFIQHTKEAVSVQSPYGENFTFKRTCKNSVHQMGRIRRISTFSSRQMSCDKVYFLFAGLQLEPTTRIAYPDPVTNLAVKAQVYNASRRLLQLAVSWIPPTGMLRYELNK
jgi:hypothetical protein